MIAALAAGSCLAVGWPLHLTLALPSQDRASDVDFNSLQRAAEALGAGRNREALDLLARIPFRPDLPATYFFLMGMAEARLGQLEKAEQNLAKATSLDPNRAEAHFALGLVNLQRDQPSKAVQSLRKATELDERMPESWLALGKALLKVKDSNNAEKAFQTATQLAPLALHIRLGVALAYQEEGMNGKAAPYFEAASKLDSANVAARLGLARSLLRSGQAERAATLAQSWTNGKPRDSGFIAELGIVFAEQRSYKQAIKLFQQALEAGSPATHDIEFNLALAYFYEADYDQCEALGKKLLLEPSERKDQLHHLLGLVLEKRSSLVAAASEFQKAAQLNPRESDYFVHLGRIALHEAQYSEAEQQFQKAVQTCSSACTHALIGLGTSQKLQGRIDVAQRTFELASEKAPSDYLSYLYRADVLIRLGKHGEATKLANRAVQLNPSSSLAHYMTAFSIMKESSPDSKARVLFHLKETARLDPSNPLPLVRLGVLYSKDGNLEEAAKLLERATTLAPDMKEAHYQLGQAYLRLGKRDLANRQFERVRTASVKELEEGREFMQEMVQELDRASGHN
jgi:tetratricopeptide (TPR) repeat protein